MTRDLYTRASNPSLRNFDLSGGSLSKSSPLSQQIGGSAPAASPLSYASQNWDDGPSPSPRESRVSLQSVERGRRLPYEGLRVAIPGGASAPTSPLLNNNSRFNTAHGGPSIGAEIARPHSSLGHGQNGRASGQLTHLRTGSTGALSTQSQSHFSTHAQSRNERKNSRMSSGHSQVNHEHQRWTTLPIPESAGPRSSHGHSNRPSPLSNGHTHPQSRQEKKGSPLNHNNREKKPTRSFLARLFPCFQNRVILGEPGDLDLTA